MSWRLCLAPRLLDVPSDSSPLTAGRCPCSPLFPPLDPTSAKCAQTDPTVGHTAWLPTSTSTQGSVSGHSPHPVPGTRFPLHPDVEVDRCRQTHFLCNSVGGVFGPEDLRLPRSIFDFGSLCVREVTSVTPDSL